MAKTDKNGIQNVTCEDEDVSRVFSVRIFKKTCQFSEKKTSNNPFCQL